MNKRGQFEIAGLAILAVITLIILAVFYFSSTFRFMVLGLGLVAMGFVVLLGTKIKRYNIKVGIFIGLLATGFILIFASGVLQNITAVSTYEDTNGDLHWLISGVADSVDEGYIFRNLPGEKTLSDGTKITPKEEAVLTVSKKESYCSYQLNQVTKERWTIVGKISMTYYELLSSERTALISVKDDSGSEQIIDGTLTQTKTFYDNGGELEFKSLGILSSKRDCTSGSDVAILMVNNAPNVKYKTELENYFYDLSFFNPLTALTEVRDNIGFTSNFNDYSVKNERFIGDLDLGNVQFTIDADQKYYNSFVYQPPKEVKPSVTLIMLSKVKTDSSFSAKAIITNKEDSEGNVVIKATTTDGSISPEGQNIILKESFEFPFVVKASSSESNVEVCVEACSTSSPINCDEDCSSYESEDDAEEIDTCGDGTCQNYESITSCPSDCKLPAECEKNSDCEDNEVCKDSKCVKDDEGICNWYETEYTETQNDYGALYWRAYTPFIDPIETEVTGCKTAGWVNISAIAIVITILGSVAIVSMKPKRRKRK